jgi:catechol 2,3-dioxygenase-like lactoylglutathione lyase family enzyme
VKLTGVCIITDDVQRLRTFYEKVLQIESQGEGDFAGFETGSGTLSIFSVEGTERLAPGSTAGHGYGGCFVEFEVQDVDAACERLQAVGVEWVKPPGSYAWGRRSAWFRDPAGNIVNIHMAIDPEP